MGRKQKHEAIIAAKGEEIHRLQENHDFLLEQIKQDNKLLLALREAIGGCANNQ